MSDNYTRARQAINCRGRQCLRVCRPLRPSVIERRIGQTRTTMIELASSLPTPRWCDRRGRIIDEVLDLAGFQPRGDRIPIIDGDRSTIRNVVGSVHGLKIRDRSLVGNIVFARDSRSRALAAKYNDHHLPGIFEADVVPLEMIESQQRDIVSRFEVVAVRIM